MDGKEPSWCQKYAKLFGLVGQILGLNF